MESKRNSQPAPAPAPRSRDLRKYGGQHAATRGTSTRDQTDRERELESLADFNAAWERIRYGTVAGRKC